MKPFWEKEIWMKEYGLFADILGYPGPLTGERIAELLTLVAAVDRTAARDLERFRESVAETAQTELEELYTRTFDMHPLCCPYVGHQLFGEEFRRGMFMALLREHYRLCGFDAGNELPDHLCVILRFLEGREPGEVERELVSDCLVPSLGKMVASLGATENPYLQPLRALLGLIAGMPGGEMAGSKGG